jgi:hypothetical protein
MHAGGVLAREGGRACVMLTMTGVVCKSCRRRRQQRLLKRE